MTTPAGGPLMTNGGNSGWEKNSTGSVARSPTSSPSAGSASCSSHVSTAHFPRPTNGRSGSVSSVHSHSWGSPGSLVSEVMKMAQTILQKLDGAVAFLRRKIEVWFVLLIVIAMGVLGWLGFMSVEDTQTTLCRTAQASAATKDKFVDVFVRGGGVDESNEFIMELRRYVQEERDQLSGSCPLPTDSELVPATPP